MTVLYVVLGMIAGGTVAALIMAMLLLSKNADGNANKISSNMSFDGAYEELTDHRV
jgi:hypothetical protein